MRRTPSKGRITRNSFQTMPETECGPQHLVVWPRQGMPLLTSAYRTHLPVTKRKSSGGRMGGGRARTSPPGERLPSPRPAPRQHCWLGADQCQKPLSAPTPILSTRPTPIRTLPPRREKGYGRGLACVSKHGEGPTSARRERRQTADRARLRERWRRPPTDRSPHGRNQIRAWRPFSGLGQNSTTAD